MLDSHSHHHSNNIHTISKIVYSLNKFYMMLSFTYLILVIIEIVEIKDNADDNKKLWKSILKMIIYTFVMIIYFAIARATTKQH
jgi:hypothetical protein